MYPSSILRTLASREIFFEGRHWIHFPRYAYREGYPGPGSSSWTTSECHPGTQPSSSPVGHEDLILKPGAITGLWRDTLAAQGTHRPGKMPLFFTLLDGLWSADLVKNHISQSVAEGWGQRQRAVSHRSLFSYCGVWSPRCFSWTSHGPLKVKWNIVWPKL